MFIIYLWRPLLNNMRLFSATGHLLGYVEKKKQNHRKIQNNNLYLVSKLQAEYNKIIKGYFLYNFPS